MKDTHAKYGKWMIDKVKIKECLQEIKADDNYNASSYRHGRSFRNNAMHFSCIIR